MVNNFKIIFIGFLLYINLYGDNKWITPTDIICKANSGEIFKGICQATWQEAEEICKETNGVLPSINELREVVVDCGGIIDIGNKNKANKFYQSCYKAKGFSKVDWYWTHVNNCTNAWVVHFYGGNGYGNNKKDTNLVRCVRESNSDK